MILLLRYSVETASVGDVPLQLPVSISYVKAKLDVFNSKTRQGFQKVLERDGICLVTPQTSPPSPKKKFSATESFGSISGYTRWQDAP